MTALACPAGAYSAGDTPIPTQIPGHDAILMGTAWYPEQWPEATWEKDLELMEASHLKGVPIGEFAWGTMEPAEGKFDFGWLQRAIRLAEKHHIAVVLGTPTATPPAWLTQKYPETLRTESNGRKDGYDNRQKYDWYDPKY